MNGSFLRLNNIPILYCTSLKQFRILLGDCLPQEHHSRRDKINLFNICSVYNVYTNRIFVVISVIIFQTSYRKYVFNDEFYGTKINYIDSDQFIRSLHY